MFVQLLVLSFNISKMLLSLQSTGPQYNHLQTNIQIPWNCEYIKYHVASINTRDILIITKDDVIEFELNNGKHTIECDNLYEVNDDYIERVLTSSGHACFQMKWMMNGQIELTPLVDGFKFTRISHRLGLITGLYNIKLNEVYPANVPFYTELPIVDYANKLYRNKANLYNLT